MNTNSSRRLAATIALVLAAGGVSTALAQAQKAPAAAPPTMAPSTSTPTDAAYHSARWMISRPVVNQNAEEVASVSDLILDRGSGRIEYMVIKTGGMLGMGGREVAMPFSSFSTDTVDRSRFALSVTPEQLKEFPEYSSDTWKAMRGSGGESVAPLAKRLAADASAPADPFGATLSTATAARLDGVVTDVERVRTTTFGEQVEITVRTADGQSQRVALGPSWFVNLSPSAPMRGDTVRMSTLTLPRDPGAMQVATALHSGDRELKLRETDGRPLWSADASGRSVSRPQLRYVLLSELNGAEAECRGANCGKVHDLIVDRRSGQMGFISIDPNVNFLGIGDTKRLIPWTVASVTELGAVRLDASKEMVLASIETPSDITKMDETTDAARVYKAFEVPAPAFRAPLGAADNRAQGTWAAGGPVIRGIDASSRTEISGRVVELSECRIGTQQGTARAITVRVDGKAQADQVVLIGPLPAGKNAAQFKAGDAVTIDAACTTIDGRRHWVARSITCNETRHVLVREDTNPEW